MPKTWNYDSSSSDRTYTVTHADNGLLGCNCKGWTMRRGTKPRRCKHIDDVIAKEGYTVEVRNSEYVFVVGATGLTSEPQDDTIIGEGGETQPMMTTTTTTTVFEGQKACAMVEGRYGHVLDEDGYVIPAKFDAAFGTGDWLMDEKLDGHRCQIVKRGNMITTTLRSIPSLPEQIVKELRQLPFDIHLDGELMMPGGISTDVPNLQYRHQLCFMAFDVIEAMGEAVMHLPFTERRGILETAMAHLTEPEHVLCCAAMEPTWAAVQAIFDNSGEGVILKRKQSIYRPGHRSSDWLKVKSLEHHVVTITGFEAGSLGPTAIVLGKLDDGVPVRCKNKNNAELAATAANPNSYIGRRLVVQCQQRTRGTKHLRHPMFDHWAGEGE